MASGQSVCEWLTRRDGLRPKCVRADWWRWPPAKRRVWADALRCDEVADAAIGAIGGMGGIGGMGVLWG
jgi:hypothetical protein